VAFATREGATQAAVVDLRSRSIRGILRYPAGWPRLAFSPDGQLIFAAGMNNGSVLSGWRLPADDMPRRSRWFNRAAHSLSGRSGLQWDERSGRYELFRPIDTPIVSGAYPLPASTMLVGDGYAVAFISTDLSAAVVYDLQKGQVLWQHACRLCSDVAVSDDGSHLAQVGADGLEVWDLRTGRPLFQEARRVRPGRPNQLVGSAGTHGSLSPDGRRIAWSHGDTIYVRELASGRELTLPLDGALLGMSLTTDPGRLVTVTTQSISLRDCVTGRTLWNVSNELPDAVYGPISWTPDRRALVLAHGLSATEVLDAASGERLAWFQGLSRSSPRSGRALLSRPPDEGSSERRPGTSGRCLGPTTRPPRRAWPGPSDGRDSSFVASTWSRLPEDPAPFEGTAAGPGHPWAVAPAESHRRL
jgi:hypothetical protein